MFAHGGVRHRVTPIHQSILQLFIHSFEAGRRARQFTSACRGARQRLRDLIIRDVGPDAPVRPHSRTSLVRINYLPLTQATDLVINQVKDPAGVIEPLGLRIGLGGIDPSGVAY